MLIHSEDVDSERSGLSSVLALTDGRVATISDGDLVRVWSVQSGLYEHQFNLDCEAYVREHETLALFHGSMLSRPAPPTGIDGDVATGVLVVSPPQSAPVSVVGTATGKVHFIGTHT
mgnify:CR=1 FL=1